MNRRQLLTRAIASVPLIVAGEELLELLAPHRTIFLPPRGGWTDYRNDPVAFIRDHVRATQAQHHYWATSEWSGPNCNRVSGMDLAAGNDVTVIIDHVTGRHRVL